MRISPQYTDADYKRLTFSAESEWQTAIDIFEDRIFGRFLKFVSYIEGYTYAGFAVLALDCLLIETLQQFHEGVAETPRRCSETFFVRFLTKTSFGFTEDQAKKFYNDIRCGILHQAEVKGSSKVRVDTMPLVKYTDDRKGLVINRKLFHQQLVHEFKDYVARLRNGTDQQLRDNFKKKMEYICGLSKIS